MRSWRHSARRSTRTGSVGRVWRRAGISGCCCSATLKGWTRNGQSRGRAADSLSIRTFLDVALHEVPPDHSTLSRARRLIDVETHQAVFYVRVAATG